LDSCNVAILIKGMTTSAAACRRSSSSSSFWC
jgi:hypothetical protein